MSTTLSADPKRAAMNKSVVNGHDQNARILAAAWHGGGNVALTGLSHGREWTNQRLVWEIEQELGHVSGTGTEAREWRAELEALLAWAQHHTEITVVDSAEGHRFIVEEWYSRCLACGAEYELAHDQKNNVHHGRYRGYMARDPKPCTGPAVDHEDAPGCPCLGHH
jgi:hypothetical protein